MKHHCKKPFYWLYLLFLPVLGYAQQGYKQNWVVHNPFDHRVFIENKGQIPDQITSAIKAHTLYYSERGNVRLYFTANSVVFRSDSAGIEKEGNELERKRISRGFKIEWAGANPNVTLEVQNPVSDYYTYPNPKDRSGRSGLVANAWRKLIYHDLYKGIDVEFYYPEDKGGLEYTFIVHPGADVSQIRMKYSKATISLSGNDVLISSPFGYLTDHAPVASCGKSKPASSFKISGNEVTFNTGPYDKNALLIIDPWVTTTTFSFTNRAYDIDYDVVGNVYVTGGGNIGEFELQKYNSAGILQWTYIPSFTFLYAGVWHLYGDMTVDHRNGTTYFTDGGDFPGGSPMAKVDSSGIQTNWFNGNPDLDETWRMSLDYCNNLLIIGGGNPSGAPLCVQVGTLDTGFSTSNTVNILGATNFYHDISLLALDQNGNAYMASAKSLSYTTFNNDLMRLPTPSLSPTAYMQYDGHNFYEITSFPIYPALNGGNYSGNGFNGIAVNRNILVTYDGKELKKWRPSTGTYVDSISISSTYFRWSGLEIDCAGNIYAGVKNQVNIYDSSLHFVSNIPLTDTVFDIKLGKQQLYACGAGFVSSNNYNPDTVKIKIASVAPTPCAPCNGKATAYLTGCGIDTTNFTYLWSGGQTTATITGLCPGKYGVKITVNCIEQYNDTVILVGKAGPALNVTSKNPSCTYNKDGSASVTVTGGTSPFTYSWQPIGNTTTSVSGLSAGTYTLTVKDSSGCSVNDTLILIPAALNYNIGGKDTVCTGSNTTLTVNGAGVVSYSWSNGATTSAINVSPPSNSTYSVIVTDTSGCKDTLQENVTVSPLPVASISGPAIVCYGSNTMLTAGGGGTYLWSTGSTQSTISVSPKVDSTYKVYVTLNGCSDSASKTIDVIPLNYTIGGKDTLCTGNNTTLTVSGSGVASYSWSNGATTSAINVFPTTSATYSVVVTDTSGCKDTLQEKVTVNPGPNASITGPASICNGGNITLTAGGGGTYLWSTGSTQSSISVSPKVDSTYTVYVSLNGCSDTATKKVDVNPYPVVTACCPVTIAAGQTTTLTATGGGTYLWVPSAGLSCDTCANPIASPTVTTTYTVYITSDSGCVVTDSVTIDVTCGNLFVPDAFSPNGDGQNDVFYVRGNCIQDLYFAIYDRWGNKVFETENTSVGWDGDYKGQPMNTGTYVYYLKALMYNGTLTEKKGSISLVR